ncbi:MAG: hypothetical protein IJO14_03925 [Clostridia bacterium]|nr:hypothetical protein [Clostridia bacterium]
MFEKIKKKREKKKQLKNRKTEKFISLTANGEEAPIINFEILKDDNEEVILKIHTKGETPQLHYQTVDFELKTDKKMLRVKASFKGASNLKNDFKEYLFTVEDYQQFFI